LRADRACDGLLEDVSYSEAARVLGMPLTTEPVTTWAVASPLSAHPATIPTLNAARGRPTGGCFI
jgi:hypothetical protein